MEKLARHIEVGDVIETEDGFQSCRSRVDEITYLDPLGTCDVKIESTDIAWYTSGQWIACCDPGGFLFYPDEIVEIVA